MRPPRSVRRRRIARRHMTVQVPDRASRQRGSGAGRPPTLPARRGGGRPAHLRVASAAPVHPPVSPRGGEALPAPQPARGRRPHQSATAGPALQPGPAARIYRMGTFDCDVCGTPIGRGHTDDCPKRRPSRSLTEWVELTVCVTGFTASAVTALWLRTPEIAAVFAVLAVVAWIAYRPPARGQVRRSQPPSAPAPRAPAGRSRTRPRGLSARSPVGSGAGSPGERNARMARTPLAGPLDDPTP